MQNVKLPFDFPSVNTLQPDEDTWGSILFPIGLLLTLLQLPRSYYTLGGVHRRRVAVRSHPISTLRFGRNPRVGQGDRIGPLYPGHVLCGPGGRIGRLYPKHVLCGLGEKNMSTLSQACPVWVRGKNIGPLYPRHAMCGPGGRIGPLYPMLVMPGDYKDRIGPL